MTDHALHVAVSGWLLGEPSGANRRLLRIVEHAAPMLERDERVTVLHRPDFTPPDLHERVHWRPVAIPASSTFWRASAERRLLGRELAACAANVLDHAMLPLPNAGVPTCITLHDLRAVDGHTRWPRWLARRAIASACARAAAVVVPSDFTAARVHAVAPGAAVTVVPNGVVVPPESAAPEAGHLLHVGHLERRKNVGVLLHALSKIPPEHRPGLQLVGRDAGDGAALRALARRLGLEHAVQFRGIVADDELARLVAGARAILVPSTYEGFGFAALDGLAAGRPTLVADAGALPEVVADAGVVLPPDDARAWAEAMQDTVVDATAAPAARRARAAEFSWQRAAAAMVALWRGIAVSARGS